jgi:superfamily II DNA or RNA helicase
MEQPMIPAQRIDAQVAPRFRLFGLIKEWHPEPATPRHYSCQLFPEVPEPHRTEAEFPVPEAFRVVPDDLSSGRVCAYQLGSFDLEPRTALPGSANRPLVPLAPTSPQTQSPRTAIEASPEKILAAILQPPLELLLSPEQVLDWPAPLLPYQKEGIKALLDRPRLLLADDMGLGKTVQVIAALRLLAFRGEVSQALVVCPTSVLRQWQDEFRKWAPELKVVPVNAPPECRAALWRRPAHVHLVSYETLRGDVLDLQDSPALRETWDAIVLDEASRIKNRETGVALAVKRIPAPRRWALTGTPLENRVEDVASILEFLLNEPSTGRRRAVGPEEVCRLLSEYQLRRRKQDVLTELPPKRVVELFIELLPSQRESYDRAEREGVISLKEKGDSVTVDHVLALITHLKKICNSDPSTRESSKLNDLRERMESLVSEGHRALVFSQFTNEEYGVQRVADELKAFSPLVLTGEMSQQRRNEVVERFRSDDAHKLLVLSLRAGGVGLNLQSASYVFHLDRWWNPAIEEQAEDRAHRMGQSQPVICYRYICENTIEERIHQRLEEKRALFREIVDDVSIDLSRMLTADELFSLFDLQMPRRKAPPRRDSGEPDFADMSGEEFEAWIRSQLESLGYEADLTPRSRDGGIDIIAHREEDGGLVDRCLLIQCKNTADPAGVEVVRELHGAAAQSQWQRATLVVACPSGFTADAVAAAKKLSVKLWSLSDLRNLAELVANG